MTRKWDDLRPRGWRFRARVKMVRMGWWLRRVAGRCDHSATVGPAGGGEGHCLICRKDVPWNDE